MGVTGRGLRFSHLPRSLFFCSSVSHLASPHSPISLYIPPFFFFFFFSFLFTSSIPMPFSLFPHFFFHGFQRIWPLFFPLLPQVRFQFNHPSIHLIVSLSNHYTHTPFVPLSLNLVFNYSPGRWWSKNTVAIVTGANKGIGFALVRKLAQSELTVVLTARDEVRGLKAVETLRNEGLGHVLFRRLDVSDPDSIVAFAAWFASNFQALDILVSISSLIFGINLPSFLPSFPFSLALHHSLARFLFLTERKLRFLFYFLNLQIHPWSYVKLELLLSRHVRINDL